MRRSFPITVSPEHAQSSACEGSEAFALMVLGDSMLPEFAHGHVVIVEPGGRVTDGAFVLARLGEEWILRQLRLEGDGWILQPLNPAYPSVPIENLGAVHGVVIQRVRPGRRRDRKYYVE